MKIDLYSMINFILLYNFQISQKRFPRWMIEMKDSEEGIIPQDDTKPLGEKKRSNQ